MKKTGEKTESVANQDEILAMLTVCARDGNVQAMKALLSWHEVHSPSDEQPADDDWSAIYGDNVTPLRRSAS